MKKISPALLTLAATLAGTGFVATPAQAALTTGASWTANCSRTNVPTTHGGTTTARQPMVTLDGTNTGLVAGDYTYVVTWTDGTTTGTLTDTAAGDLAGTFTDLPAGKVPSRITITQNGDTQTYSFSSVTNCAPAIPAPTLHQTVVSGDGNDTYTLTYADGTAVPSSAITDDGWLQLGDTWKKRITVTTDGWFTDGTTVGNTVTYIMTDAGPSTTETKPIMGTRTEPVYTSRTTCTDPVVGTFQVDQYTPRTRAQVATLAANSARNTLPYRYDGPNAPQLSKVYRKGTYASLWGTSKVEFVTVKASDVTKAGSLAKAINAKTRSVANLGGSLAVGRTWTTAWKLAAGATTKAPWTNHPDTSTAKAQTEYDRVAVPKAVCTTTKVQTGTRTVTYDTGRTRTVEVLPTAPAASVTIGYEMSGLDTRN